MSLCLLPIPQQPGKAVGPQLNGADIVVFCPVHQLGIAALPVDPGIYKLTAEIEQADQLPVSQPAAEGQYPAVAAVLHMDIRLGIEAGLPGPELLQPPQTLEQLALVGVRVAPPLRQLPLEGPPVNIPAVLLDRKSVV